MDNLSISAVCAIASAIIMGISYFFYAVDWIQSSLLTKKEERSAYLHEMYYAFTVMFAFPAGIIGTEPTGLRLLCLILVLGALGSYCYMTCKHRPSQRKTTSDGDLSLLIYNVAGLIYIISAITWLVSN